MKYIRITALVLCAVFLFVLLTANEPATVAGSRPDMTEEDNTAWADAGLFDPDYELPFGFDTLSAMNTFSPDTVMLSTGEYTVNWGYFYFILHSTAAQLTGGFTIPVDWYEETPAGEGTWSDIVIDYVVEQAEQSILFDYGVDVLGVTMDVEESEYYQGMFDEMLLEYGGIENFEKDLRRDGFASFEVYSNALMNFALQEQMQYMLMDKLIDETTDENVEEFAQSEGYMQAKHILVMIPSEYDGFSEEELEDLKIEAFEKISEIYGDLLTHADDDDFIGYFEAAIFEHSEDPGSFSYPDGYLFRAPDMVPEFSEATEALLPGQMSGIVETGYGYHIILRLPLDYDNITPIEFANYGQLISLRQLAAFNEFDNLLTQWQSEMDIVRSPELESLDLGILFAWQE